MDSYRITRWVVKRPFRLAHLPVTQGGMPKIPRKSKRWSFPEMASFIEGDVFLYLHEPSWVQQGMDPMLTVNRGFWENLIKGEFVVPFEPEIIVDYDVSENQEEFL